MRLPTLATPAASLSSPHATRKVAKCNLLRKSYACILHQGDTLQVHEKFGVILEVGEPRREQTGFSSSTSSMSQEGVNVTFFCKLYGVTKAVAMTLDSLKTIGDVAEGLRERLEVNADMIEIIHKGRLRKHEATLEDAEIEKESTLYVSVKKPDKANGPSSSLASTSRKPPGHTREPVVFNYKVHGGNYASGELMMHSYFTLREICDVVGGRHGIEPKDLRVANGGSIHNQELTIELANIARGHTVDLLLMKKQGE